MHRKVKIAATHIVGVYWKTHIQVKYQSSAMYGSKILIEEIQAQKLLFVETEELSNTQKSVQQNCFFAHLENLIPTKLNDEDKAIQTKAVMIEKIRCTQKNKIRERPECTNS